MRYILYKTTNLINNKIYIGKHQTTNINDGYLGSGTILKRSIEKYGADKFKREVLFECSNVAELNELEADIVNEEFIARLDTYNIKLGGYGGFDFINSTGKNLYEGHDEQAKKNIKKAKIQAVKFHVKRKHDKELDNEYRQKLSNSLKLYYRYHPGTFKGRCHTKETKRKIGIVTSKSQRGSGNSQYGTCWIYNISLAKSKKIKQHELDDFISKGWCKGRKLKF